MAQTGVHAALLDFEPEVRARDHREAIAAAKHLLSQDYDAVSKYFDADLQGWQCGKMARRRNMSCELDSLHKTVGHRHDVMT